MSRRIATNAFRSEYTELQKRNRMDRTELLAADVVKAGRTFKGALTKLRRNRRDAKMSVYNAESNLYFAARTAWREALNRTGRE